MDEQETQEVVDLPKENVEDVVEESNTTEQLVSQLKAEYEEKITKIIQAKNKEIAERDCVIKELISGEKTEPVKPGINVLIEEINAKREKQIKY